MFVRRTCGRSCVQSQDYKIDMCCPSLRTEHYGV